MGQEITKEFFKYHDFRRFAALLHRETELLHRWIAEDRFSQRRAIAGLELEAWLVDDLGEPVPCNDQVLERLDSDDVVRELSRFNVEFNVQPEPLAGMGLDVLTRRLAAVWQRCDEAAAQCGASVVYIGILPTITDPLLTLRNMSNLVRYRALNEQILRLRQGKPIRLEIHGREQLQTVHGDVMLEAATTSLQLHLQVPFSEAVRYYNAAVIASGPMIAVTANSPLLFGAFLWDETRITVFEQALDVGEGRLPRVTLGTGYLRESFAEIFDENRDHYSILLPLTMDDVSERLEHLRLHNGTIWRWNRPLIGFDDDGTPHARVEHRVMAAGPTIVDTAANMAFYFGLVESLASATTPPETRLDFQLASENLYRAARWGLASELEGLDGQRRPAVDLILRELLPLAARGLESLRVDAGLAGRLLSIIEQRVRAHQTGADWQRRFIERHGRDLRALTCAYRDRQRSGEPVHTWTV